MPRRSKEETFRIISAALAIIEEAGATPLAELAQRVGVGRDALYEMLEPVLFHEFRGTDGDMVRKADAFLLDDDDCLRIDSDNWLRSLASQPPDFDTALRLFVAGTVFRSLSSGASPYLDRALGKLEQTIAADVVVAVDSPEFLSVAQQANSRGRTLEIRYVNDRGEVGDRTIEPWLVFNNWGRWYVHGGDLGDSRAKWFRVDRIVSAQLGPDAFEPPPDVEIPEWFDLGGEETVTLRMPADAVDALPTPRRIDALVRSRRRGRRRHRDGERPATTGALAGRRCRRRRWLSSRRSTWPSGTSTRARLLAAYDGVEEQTTLR